MLRHYRPPRRPLVPFMSNVAVLSSFLLALFSTAYAVPIPASSHQVPDLWAQLLRANRFKLIPSSTWVTRGLQPSSSSHQSILAHRPSQTESVTSSPAQLQFLRLNPAMRQKTYQSKKASSRFTCHVFNPPANLNVDAIIARVLVIASESWSSDQEVLMKVHFRDLGEPSVLASGGGTYFVRMSDTFSTVLPVAAAEAFRKQDLNGNESDDGKYDVLVTVNSRTPWYDGVDGKPPTDKYDLITVLLHEIYHNLVFAGSVTATTQRLSGSNNARQSASLHQDYRTRFDSFLKNEQDCAVLDYLTDTELSNRLKRPTNELLADAVCNDRLFWGYGARKVAKLYSPRIFQNKSSIYHFDERAVGVENSLMYPTVRRGTAQHRVGPIILEMQKITLDPSIPGANTQCSRPLQDPTPRVPIQVTDYQEQSDLYDSQPLVLDNRYVEENRNRIAGLPVWAFALIIVFAILLALLLLGLCLALLLRALKKKRPKRSSSSSNFKGGGTSSSRSQSYSPKFGAWSKSKKSRTSSSSRTSGLKTSVKASSKHSGWSRKSASSKHKTEVKPSSGRISKHVTTCPSSGKSKYLCCCKCCKSSITPPPPVASVHTFDPDSVPTSHKHKSHKTSSHRHTHTCKKTVKKTCKSRSSKSCSCSCYCCRYKPSSCKTSTTCCKSTCKVTTTRCPPSTKPPSTKPASTKVASSSKHCCSSKHCSSKTPSSRSCSCGKSTTKVPSTKPPSTKPPTAKPSTKVASSSKSCRTCKASCRTCKPSAKGCACNRCEQVVEINIC